MAKIVLRYQFAQSRVDTIYIWGTHIYFKIACGHSRFAAVYERLRTFLLGFVLVQCRCDNFYKWGGPICFMIYVCSISFWHHLEMRGYTLTLIFVVVQSRFGTIYKWGQTFTSIRAAVRPCFDTIYKWGASIDFQICSCSSSFRHHL